VNLVHGITFLCDDVNKCKTVGIEERVVTSLQMLSNVVGDMPNKGVLDHLEISLKDPFTSLLVLEVIYFLRSNMKHRPEDIGLSPPVS
jgi:hypothetical protein